MPPFRKKTQFAAEDTAVGAETPSPACHVTITGPVKGHPPVTIACYGGTPKDAVNALKRLLAGGKLKVT